MAKVFFILLLYITVMPANASTYDAVTDSLIHVIDDEIAHSDDYVAQREARINTLRSALNKTDNPYSAYELSFNLYEEYRPFVNDSAIYFLNRCIDYAIKLQQPAKANLCRSLLALRCSNTGMYDESLYILSNINVDEMDKKSIGVFYYALTHVYNELAYYTHLEDMRKLYTSKKDYYRKLMLASLPPYDNNRILVSEEILMSQKRYKESMQLNSRWVNSLKKGSYPYAMATLYRYLEYKNIGDTVRMMHWLAESVITDIRNGVTDQGSMWEMANQLMLKGDFDRAYKYITFTSNCANRFGSRQRQSQITPLLAVIADKYRAQRQTTYHQLLIALGIVTIFVIVALALYFYANTQRKHLALARAKLRHSNSMLQKLNSELQTLNGQLKESNGKLTEANRVKDEYLGRFMSMCSIYIDRIDSLRKKVNKLVKSRQYESLYQLTHSSDFRQKELDELYENFDVAFLNLFPDFVNQFNALLKPENRIELTETDRLNTTLRIFALIRLGIEDSGKIAEFLHYSVNTIYNYRAQIKNGALVDRKEFEAMVKEIA